MKANIHRFRGGRRLALIMLLAVLPAQPWAPVSVGAATPYGLTTLVSAGLDGRPGNNFSWEPALSGDGRYVAFQSHASNLVPYDTNEHLDIFVLDRQTNEMSLVSVASNGAQAHGESLHPSISDDGRLVAFGSYANDLVPNDTNRCYVQDGTMYEHCLDAFVHDRLTGQTIRVSVAANGAEAAYGARYPVISGDGRFVAFASFSPNLAPHDTNAQADVFVHDLQTGQTELVSVASDGTQGNGPSGYYRCCAISADGRYVAFSSFATNLVPGYVPQCPGLTRAATFMSMTV